MEEYNSGDDIKLMFTTTALSGISTYAVDTTCGNTIQAQTSTLLSRTEQSGVPTFVPLTTIGLIGELSSLLSIAVSGMYGSAPASSEIYDKTDYSSVERNAKLIYDRLFQATNIKLSNDVVSVLNSLYSNLMKYYHM